MTINDTKLQVCLALVQKSAFLGHPNDRATFEKVVQMVLDGLVPNVRETCRHYKLPEATVRTNVAKLRAGQEIPSGALGVTNRRLLTEAEETVLCNLIIDAQRRGLPVTRRNIINFIEDILNNDRTKPEEEPSERLQRQGVCVQGQEHDKWFRGFMKRHKDRITVKKTELLGKARMAVTEQQILQWFADRQTLFDDLGFKEVIRDPRRSFNFDETSIHLGATIKTCLALKVTKPGDPKHCFMQCPGASDKTSVTSEILVNTRTEF